MTKHKPLLPMTNVDDAPKHLTHSEAFAYMDGYNAAVEADTARLSELEAENRRMRWALDYFKRIADERERTPAGELVVVSIESCRDARAALEAQS